MGRIAEECRRRMDSFFTEFDERAAFNDPADREMDGGSSFCFAMVAVALGAVFVSAATVAAPY